MFSLIVGIRLVIFFVSPSLFILFYAPLIKVHHMSLFLLFFSLIKKSNFKWKIKSNTTHTIVECGAKGSGDSGPFHIKLKAHAEEEEIPEDE